MLRFSTKLILASCTLVAFCPWARAQVTYNVTDLGTLGGNFSFATDINNTGDVVGASGPTGTTGGNFNHAFLYRGGVMTDLGVPLGSSSVARAVNLVGQVIVNTGGGAPEPQAFLLSNGTFTRIDPPGFTVAEAHDINDPGQVVGFVDSPTGGGAFLYSNGQFSLLDLSSLGAIGSDANAINNSGQIVGSFARINPQTNAFERFGFHYANGIAQNLGLNVFPQAINAAGDIVGAGVGAFLYRNGQLIIIGGGTASDINNQGDIVGNNNFGAFFYSNGVLTDLNTLIPLDSGLRLISANAINDAGQIVGGAITASGDSHAYLLTPIPEPAGLAIVLVGAATLLRRRAG